MPFATTHVEHLEISRLIVGSNWFLGYSHTSAAKDRWIKSYMTIDRMVEVMSVFARNGINAVMSMQNPTMREVIRRVKEETGVDMHWICTPSGEGVEDLLPGIEESAEMGASICMPHQHWTDGNMLVNQKRIIGLEQVTARIRELGMIPGLSTHRPETVVLCDKAGYDVATYIQIYNAIGFLCQVETDWIAHVINATPKPVMCIKPLAAGRILPPTGLSFVYNSIKPTDMVCIGTLSVDEAEQDIHIARELISRGQADTMDLTFSRSKKALVE
ncbi:MAG: hypothetical protein ACYC5M_16890 [Anaerolineae bacterium]